MYIIQKQANIDGARPSLQEWSNYKEGAVPPKGFLWCPDKYLSIFYDKTKRCAGFVNIKDKDYFVTSMTWNDVAYNEFITTLPDPADGLKKAKIDEVSKCCEQEIYKGTDVTYADGTVEHFTYSLVDQSNISEMFTAIMAGATEYPYHADGEICKIYSKEQIVTIYGTLSLFKTEATTYHNSLKAQVSAMTDADAITAVKFKETELTGEYLENYAAMMASAKTQLEAILARIPTDETTTA